MSRLLQVELWSDFISAGGTRELIIPLPQIFSATLNEDVRRFQRDLQLVVDAAISDQFGGGVTPANIILLRTFNGLVQLDPFTRANSPVIGNGWSEAEINANSWEIQSNTAFSPTQPNSNANKVHRATPALPLDHIIQTTFDDLQTFGGHGVFSLADPAQVLVVASGPTITWTFGTAASNYGFFHVPGPGPGGSFPCGQVGGAAPAFRNMRMSIDDLGTGFVDARGYFVGASSLIDLSQDPVLTQTCTGLSIPTPTATDYGFQSQRSGRHDMFFACGRDVVVTGLPTGFSIRLHGVGGPTAPEVGGIATLDPSATRLPYSTVQVLNVGGQIVGSALQPPVVSPYPGDGWGGDLYTATVVSSGAFTRGAERKVLRCIFANGAVEEFRIN